MSADSTRVGTVDVGREVEAVPPRGYRWWYLDGLSRDGHRGFTAIFLIGSVFSPWMRRRALTGERVPAREHLGLHLALYEDGRELAWTMSEYGGGLIADGSLVRFGGSSLTFEPDGGLTARFDELTAPPFWSGIGLGSPMRGRVRLRPSATATMAPVEIGRSPGAAHHWQVRVPRGDIEVEFDRPGFAFQGGGYHDTNWGDGRLEETFRRWSWARFHKPDHSRILYAVEPRRAQPHGFVVKYEGASHVDVQQARPARFADKVPVAWGLHAPRGFSIEAEGETDEARVVRWLDRTPFYARYVASLGAAQGVGEYLDLDRYTLPTVQFLLRWRAQRR